MYVCLYVCVRRICMCLRTLYIVQLYGVRHTTFVCVYVCVCWCGCVGVCIVYSVCIYLEQLFVVDSI